MSDLHTKSMLRPFIETAPSQLFLGGFFKSPPENFHTSESVEIDIQRDGEDVSVPVQDLASGARYNANSVGTNKEFTPPVHKERFTLQAHKLMSRELGENPFQSLAFQARATIRAGRDSAKGVAKIRRSIEWQASQVLQTGAVTLVDENGYAAYQINYSPKAEHFAPVSSAWLINGTGGDRFTDIETRAALLRRNGHRSPNVLVFGGNAWNLFIAPDKVKDALRRDGLGLGALNPVRNGSDSATLAGYIWIGPYKYECWLYDGSFLHPQTNEPTPYVGQDNIVMLSSNARLDLSFGDIPRFAPPDQRLMQFLPRRVSDSDKSVDMHLAAWLEPSGETMTLQVGCRPLAIATEIDSFGCLDVTGA